MPTARLPPCSLAPGSCPGRAGGARASAPPPPAGAAATGARTALSARRGHGALAQLPQQLRGGGSVCRLGGEGDASGRRAARGGSQARPGPGSSAAVVAAQTTDDLQGAEAETAASGTDVLIECKGVKKAFGSKVVLDGASFCIRRGEAVGIIGPSGTGKSTILKIMAGLLMPDEGEVVIMGKTRAGLVSDEVDSPLRVGMVFQSAALFDSLTVGENVGFLLYENSKMPEQKIKATVADSLAKVGLKGVENMMPAALSGGQRKRVALARAIIKDEDAAAETMEEVLMYDEPTAGLDPIASTVVEDLIRSLGGDVLGGGGGGDVSSYIVVTHQHSTIRRAVDRLIFLHQGKVVWEGPSSEFETSDHPIVRQFATGNLNGPITY